MTAWDDKNRDGPDFEGRALWKQSRQAFLRKDRASDEIVDPLVLSAYLEGRLSERESAALEAALAGSEAGLDLLLASREALDAPPEAVSDRVVRRAQSLTGFEPTQEKQSLFAWLFGGSPLRPLAAAGAFAAYLLVCVVSFDLGRGEGYSLAGLDEGPAVADLDDDLDLAGLDDEFVTAELDDEPAQDPLWDLEIEDVL